MRGRDETRIPRAGLHRALTGTAFTPLWVVVAAVGIRMVSLDTLLALRWALPAVMFLLTVGLLAGIWRQWLGHRAFAWAAIGLTLIDLYAFGAVYRRTYNDLMSVEAFYELPASLQFFPDEPSGYRILTHQAIVPALSVMRASLYPNISLLHGISSANGYFPLTPARHARYLAGLTPGRLNLLNARYFVIPQLLPVDPETEQYDLHDPYMPDPVDAVVEIPPTHAEAVELTSFTSQSADWPQGQLVAQIVLTGDAGARVTLPVRAGVETAEWAYDRSDVVEQVAHERPPVARTWPARSGFPPEDHPGHAYRARYWLPQPMTVTSVQVVPIRPAGLIHIEDLTLVGPKSQRSLAELLGLGRHQLVYRDPDVAIYENLDALPRAFVVEHARVVPDDAAALSLIDDPDFDPCREVLLADRLYTQQGGDVSAEGVRRAVSVEGPGLTSLCSTAVILEYAPHRVMIQAELEHPGYLVLLDSYYPGWRAIVDGRQAPILRADVLFRAVRLEPGRHQVTFVFDPLSYRIGKLISSMMLAGLVIALAWLILRRLRTLRG
ncbi:MAG: hypothetical protein D6791_09110 [Chloroflexi bacterium]|nr:MAG: hypothetical protein D6791_09110 [Chloroflexota bacterium]